ncbi:MAG: 2-oxoacid:acceptor oxidoreductase family protein [Planctomycetaceae bacterium]|jgi:2-oxoisovalerate ferredoxin oxidoreductase beta subunit|nr:2-oxoacid:acceptor oxidoreductase family protein [Planctomycetaceae bacterium]
MTKILKKPAVFFDTFQRKPDDNKQTTHYCPGCGHGILSKIIAEAIDELNIQDSTILVGPVGCGVFVYYYFNVAAVSSAHGRASAVATGVSRANPNGVTIAYQGDGDLAAIGTSNAIHAANRGENMIVFFVNNNVYGMTGGQLAPTSIVGQKTTTSPYGRSLRNDGPPLRMSEIIATLEAPVLVARMAVNSPKNVRNARKLIRRGLEAQVNKKGYVFLEVLSQCPTNWRKTPVDACKWIDEEVTPIFPIGVFKDTIDQAEPQPRDLSRPDFSEVIESLGLKAEEPCPAEDRPLPYPVVRLKSAGFGGQGVLSLGTILASAVMKKGLEVTWLPSYGPEMRGGVANCSVVISKEPISSPIVDQPNILIAMNKPSMQRFAPLVPKDGLILYNSSMIDTIPASLAAPVIPVPAADIAQKAGNVKAANVVILGVLLAKTGLLSFEEMSVSLQETFTNPKLCEINQRALQLGFDAAN